MENEHSIFVKYTLDHHLQLYLIDVTNTCTSPLHTKFEPFTLQNLALHWIHHYISDIIINTTDIWCFSPTNLPLQLSNLFSKIPRALANTIVSNYFNCPQHYKNTAILYYANTNNYIKLSRYSLSPTVYLIIVTCPFCKNYCNHFQTIVPVHYFSHPNIKNLINNFLYRTYVSTYVSDNYYLIPTLNTLQPNAIYYKISKRKF